MPRIPTFALVLAALISVAVDASVTTADANGINAAGFDNVAEPIELPRNAFVFNEILNPVAPVDLGGVTTEARDAEDGKGIVLALTNPTKEPVKLDLTLAARSTSAILVGRMGPMARVIGNDTLQVEIAPGATVEHTVATTANPEVEIIANDVNFAHLETRDIQITRDGAYAGVVTVPAPTVTAAL